MSKDRKLLENAMKSIDSMSEECKAKAISIIELADYQAGEIDRFFSALGLLDEAITIDQAIETVKDWKQKAEIITGNQEDFEIWWHNEGSGMQQIGEEDVEDFALRITGVAWSNGAYKALENKENNNEN